MSKASAKCKAKAKTGFFTKMLLLLLLMALGWQLHRLQNQLTQAQAEKAQLAVQVEQVAVQVRKGNWENASALARAAETVDHPGLKAKLAGAVDAMTDPSNPRGLTQVLAEFGIFEPLYQRLLEVGTRSGSTEEVLGQLSGTFFEDALSRIDGALDLLEPAFAVFLTVTIGVTLIAVMLPLVGIMGSIG